MLTAESERERHCIHYTVYKSSCATSSEARWKYGFDRMGAEEIHLAIDELARTQDKSLLESLGIQDDSSSESDEDTEMQMDLPAEATSIQICYYSS